MLKIRRSRDHPIFSMGIPILVRRHLYIEMAPRALIQHDKDNMVMRPSSFYNQISYMGKTGGLT